MCIIEESHLTILSDDVIYDITCLQKTPKVKVHQAQNVHWSMTRNHTMLYFEISRNVLNLISF